MKLTFCTDKIIPAWAAGCAIGPVILIRPKYRDDAGLLAHEMVHRQQWIRTLGLHSFFYMWSSSCRLASEVEAYREQLKHYPDDRSWRFAEFVATRYGLDISTKEVHRLLVSATVDRDSSLEGS